MARLRSITNSNLNLRRRREDKADADADDDNLQAQVPARTSITSPTINQSINHRHLAAAACKRM